ncbi:hypothetical protein LTR85_009693 [Meristemomyces frigidus]|nr:hypothetical protein LTR85_009693 [Meristemomyces frigidus]
MSSPSTGSNQSTSSPGLAAGDDDVGSSKQSREHGNHSGRASQTPAESPVVQAKKPMSGDRTNFLVHENLFRSAVSHAEDEDDGPTYPDAAPEELLPPPDFKPFFTLIENPNTGEHHHPSVHYLFSDDDEEIFTDATLMAIDQAAVSGELAEVEERIVIVDMAADGKSATSATSLSPRWQALRTLIGQAPSWGDSSNAAERGLMLKISGQDASSAASRKDNRTNLDSMEELAKKFGEQLSSLDEVLGKEAEVGEAQEASIQESSSNA